MGQYVGLEFIWSVELFCAANVGPAEKSQLVLLPQGKIQATKHREISSEAQ